MAGEFSHRGSRSRTGRAASFALAAGVVAVTILAPGAAAARPKVVDLVKTTTVRSYTPEFYGPADEAAVRTCLHLAAQTETLIQPEYRKCRNASYEASSRLPLWLVEVRVTAGRASADEEVRELALLAAVKAGQDSGHKFLIDLAKHQIVTCSGVPVSSTSATISGNSIYGTTTYGNYSTCSLLYTAEYLVFDDYEVVRRGVLSNVKEGRGALHPDLYYDIVDHIADTGAADSTRREYFAGHPLEAWTRYLPVADTYAALVAKYGLREPLKFAVGKSADPIKPTASVEGRLMIHATPP